MLFAIYYTKHIPSSVNNRLVYISVSYIHHAQQRYTNLIYRTHVNNFEFYIEYRYQRTH